VSFFLAIRGPIGRLPLVDWLRAYDAAECQPYVKRTLKQLLPGDTGSWVIGSGVGDDCQELVQSAFMDLVGGVAPIDTTLGTLVARATELRSELCIWWATDCGSEFEQVIVCEDLDDFLEQLTRGLVGGEEFQTLRYIHPHENSVPALCPMRNRTCRRKPCHPCHKKPAPLYSSPSTAPTRRRSEQ
jgi:hypothetical protein